MTNCPKCGYENKNGEMECQKCGIIFKKYTALQKEKTKETQSLMMKCKVCDKEISKNAKACPHCGEQNKNIINASFDEITQTTTENPFKKKLSPTEAFGKIFIRLLKNLALIVGAITLIIAILIFSVKFKLWDPSGETPVPAISIDAKTLFSEYESNEIRADDRYKGKILRVNGSVGLIAKDVMNKMYVTLHTENRIFSIQCFFDEKYAKTLACLKKNDFVTITGRCDGKFGNVMLKDCLIKMDAPTKH